MARSKNYLHNRFDGGMTHNNRDTSDLTKSSFIAHMDIYRENHRAYVMPGFVSDNAYDGDAAGLKQFGIKNFVNTFGTLYGLGTRADGTGSKIMQRTLTDAEWKVPTVAAYQGEGAQELPTNPFFAFINGDFYYPVVDGGQLDVAKSGSSANAFAGGYEGGWSNNWVADPTTPNFLYAVKAFDGKIYLNRAGFSGVSLLATTGVTTPKTTAIFPRTFASGDYTLGIFGTQSDPRESRVLIWDSASLLADQNIRLGAEIVAAAGYPNNVYCAVSTGRIGETSGSNLEENGKGFMSIRALSGESAQVLYRMDLPTDTNQTIHNLNDYYFNSMLWYGRMPINAAGTEFKEGIWALGSGSSTSQFGVSMLVDTGSLGLVNRAASFGFGMYFAHSTDGSVSHLDDFESGTYNIPGYIETLFYGADTPFLKQFEGLSVVTEDLPSGGSVEVQYRFDENDAWVSLGTSSEAGKEVHNFTKAAGLPIGKFREIQFKIILSGKISLKSYLVSTTETDDLPYKV